MHTNSIEARPIWQLKAAYASKVIGIVMLSTWAFFALSTFPNPNSKQFTMSNFESHLDVTDSDNGLTISVSNEYTSQFGQPGQLYPWINFPVVEPYRPTTLEAIDVDSPASSVTYYWTIQGDPTKYEGQTIQYDFKNIVYYYITLEQVDSTTGQVLKTSSLKVVCRYVRREIRSLTVEDREAYFDAVEILYKTSNTDGRLLYGDKFTDIDTFVALHNKRAGDINCDHMHDGYGFLNAHLIFTLAFEISLQSVNPRISVPYWDFTIDAVGFQEGDSLENFQSSVVFDDDWFGEAAPPGKVVTRGRFAYTEVKDHRYNVSTSNNNAYGYLRAPWNQNKIPYITRYDKMCGFPIHRITTCEFHYELLEMDTFSDYSIRSQYIPHGTVHTLLGGMWGADWKSYVESWGFNMSTAISWSPTIFLKYRELYRTRVLECPTYCTLDTPNSDCKCTCPHFDQFANDAEHLAELMENVLGEVDSEFHVRFLELLCSKYDDVVPIPGDHLESASPGDNSFWPIHPTMDRLFQWKRINGFKSMHWKDNSAWGMWDGITNYAGYCEGHNLNDTIGFEDIFEPYLPGVYTNADFLHFLNPENDFSPYIYDSFEWEHCVDEGYPLDLMSH